jgi:capsular polysaccharide biosynthesis protein
MEYEIDLRKYIAAILQRWRWIILCTLVAAISAAGLTYIQPRYYTAEAAVLMQIRQTGSQVGLNGPILSIETIDIGARRQGLVALANSSAIEARLPTNVIQNVAPSKYRPGQLVGEHITGHINGDLLVISARARTAEQAKELADAWAATYVSYVNELYTDEHSSVQLASNALLPYKPDSLGLVRNTVLASIGAALLSIVAALLIEIIGVPPLARNRRVRTDQPATHPSPSH